MRSFFFVCSDLARWRRIELQVALVNKELLTRHSKANGDVFFSATSGCFNTPNSRHRAFSLITNLILMTQRKCDSVFHGKNKNVLFHFTHKINGSFL